MQKLRMRIFPFILASVAFFGPLLGIFALENTKQKNKLLAEQSQFAAEREAEKAQQEYSLQIAARKNDLKEAMAEAKAQYEQLLKDQPNLIKENQKTVTQTSVEPVTTQKVVEKPAPAKKASKSSPKTSTKTKTS